MYSLIPFCPECGDPRVLVSGSHPGEMGMVYWAMYTCGHTRTNLVLAKVDGEEAETPLATVAIELA
jgi:hypothetical protein